MANSTPMGGPGARAYQMQRERESMIKLYPCAGCGVGPCNVCSTSGKREWLDAMWRKAGKEPPAHKHVCAVCLVKRIIADDESDAVAERARKGGG